MVSVILSRLVILVFGLLYPAYASYKAVKTKNIKEYVKWMMYWIVFALFTAAETFSDVLLSWIPFYYEVKMVFVFWLLSPVTQGSSFLYKKFVHPQLLKREKVKISGELLQDQWSSGSETITACDLKVGRCRQLIEIMKEIDEAIAQARTRGYSTLMTLGHKGLTYATNVVVKTAIKGQSTLVERVRSYSVNDLRLQQNRGEEELDAPYIDDSDEEFVSDTDAYTESGVTFDLTTGIDLTQNLQEGNADNSFAHQYPEIIEKTNETQKPDGSAGSVLPVSEETSQTETVSDVIETDTCLKTHKSTKDIQNRETSSKSCHDKENVKMIKKGLPNKTGAITSKKLAKKKADFHAAKSQAKSDNRLLADNRELEERGQRREQVGGRKREPVRRKQQHLVRSQSDATEIRQHRAGKTLSGLSRLEEVEHEHSYMEHSEKQDEENKEEEEEVETYSEETIYYNPRKSGHYTAKEVKSDPYATLPRTRSRQRPRLNQY